MVRVSSFVWLGAGLAAWYYSATMQGVLECTTVPFLRLVLRCPACARCVVAEVVVWSVVWGDDVLTHYVVVCASHVNEEQRSVKFAVVCGSNCLCEK
eukprot:5762385-Amphidinium_carterae.1